MRKYPFPLMAVLALLLAGSSQAAEKPRPAQTNQTQPKKIWTNDDTDQLHNRGLISIVGQEVSESTPQATAAPSETAAPVYASRLDDPAWYADQAAGLQAELDRRAAALEQQREAMEQAKNRITDPGLAMDKPSLAVSPEAAIALLEAQVNDVQTQIDLLGDLARQHDIPPGVLRG